MTLKSEIQNLLKRLKLQSTTSDVVAVESLIDRISPSVPFTFSALVQPDAGGAINGINYILPHSFEVDAALIGDMLTGFVIYLDTQRGTYWGDIDISVNANAIYDVTIALPTIDNTQCNSLVELLFNGAASAGEDYSFTITATGGGFSISRTFTLTTAP